MRTIETKLYTIDELSEEAQEKAIEQFRNSYYAHNDFSEWAIDNCYLLEPKHEELIKKFGKDFYEVLNKNEKYKDVPLIKNNRKIYFSLDRDRHIDISNAMEIRNDYYFLKWLGLNDMLIDKVCFSIGKDTIEFETNDYEVSFTEIEQGKLGLATEKFEEYCDDILTSIENEIDYRFSDEAIIEEIEANEWEFTEEGQLY